MAQNTFALMTNLGRAKEAAALANGTSVVITHIAIGDGTTVPSGGETALYHEVARKAISGHGTVVGASNVAYFDIFLEAAEGPYTIREAGLIDQDGDLIAIARYDPPISKPIPSSGQTVEGTIRLEVAFSNIAAITIVVDPSFKVALQRLNRLPWLPVISMTTAAPPSTPAIGDVYLVAPGATGAWSGQVGKIAEFTAAGWGVMTPPDGHGVSLPDGRIFERIDGNYVEKIAGDTQSGKWSYAVAGGTANALVATLSPAPSALKAGMVVRLLASTANTAAVTLNVNGLGAKNVVSKTQQTLAPGQIPAGAVAEFVYDGNSFQVDVPFAVLGAPKTYFVNAATGSDTNNGLTAGKAFLTIQRAVDEAATWQPNSSYVITISLAAGTYAGFTTPSWTFPNVVIDGGSSSATTITGVTQYLCTATGVNTVTFKNVSISNTSAITAARCLFSTFGATIILDGVRFMGMPNSLNGAFCFASSGGAIIVLSCTLSRNAYAYFYAGSSSRVVLAGGTITISEAVIAVSYFVGADSLGHIAAGNVTFVNPGNVTGARYSAILNSVIHTLGGGANYFPGNSAGTVATGGQYS